MADSQERVVVTGVGPVTGIGVGRDTLWSAIGAGESHVETRSLQVDVATFVDVPMVTLPPQDSIPGLGAHFKFLSDQDCTDYRDLAYALLAAELAISDSGLTYDRDANNVGAVQAFESPGVESTVAKLFQLMSGPPPSDGPPSVYELLAPAFYNAQPFVYVHLAGKALGLHGFSTSVHNACPSGAFAIDVAAEQIRNRRADAMIVMAGEAFDTGVRLEWFRRLGLYADRAESMKPFDPETGGFYVGEGGGAIVLESLSSALERGARVYAEYVGASFAHQAWKQTIPDVRAARLGTCIERVLAQSDAMACEVDFVLPHAASTTLSDAYELKSLTAALGDHLSSAAATAFKPYVGHTLATSGIVEIICGLIALHEGVVPATPNRSEGDSECALKLAPKAYERECKLMLKLSTGFTGHDAASLFRRAE